MADIDDSYLHSNSLSGSLYNTKLAALEGDTNLISEISALIQQYKNRKVPVQK